MARLIRTEKEVEGRYEEVWLVVEEDALEQWPAGPREVVGRPATRIDGLERARGEAVYTADLQLPGMLHTAVLRSPYAHARVTRIDLAPALALPGVHAAIGPDDLDVLDRRVRLPGRRGRGRLRRHVRAGPRRRRARSRSTWSSSRRCSTPTRRSRAGSCSASRACASAATSSRASPRRTSSSRASTAPRSSCTTRWRRTRRSCRGSATRSRSTSRRSTSGASATRSPTSLGLPADKVRVVCDYMGGGFGSKNEPGRLHVHRDRARQADAPARPLRADAARGERRGRQPQRDDPAADVGARADGTLTALGGDYVNAIGWAGWSSPVEGPMQMLYACPNVKTTTWARSSTCRR